MEYNEQKPIEEIGVEDLHVLNYRELLAVAYWNIKRVEELEDLLDDMGTELDRCIENHNPLVDYP